MGKRIIVYLLDYKTEEANIYSYAYIDFRTLKDLKLFNQLTELNLTTETVISLVNLHANKRLRRGAYYQLNLHLLQDKNVKGHIVTDDLIIGYRYDFSHTQWRENEYLLDTHEPLDREDVTFVNNATNNIFAGLANGIKIPKLRVNNLFAMLKALPEESKNKIISQAHELGYRITSIRPVELAEVLKLVFFDEEGVKDSLLINNLSKGMCRAISLLIHMEYISKQEKPSLWLIDDLGEGLDYDRVTKLGKLLFNFCLEHGIQLIVSSNDTFLMDIVDLKYWNILQREGGKVTSINIQNYPEIFEDFKFTGLSNFDFFSSDYIARHILKEEKK